MLGLSVRLSLGIALLVSGCAATPQTFTERYLQTRCQTAGGLWHTGLAREGFCEFQAPGMI